MYLRPDNTAKPVNQKVFVYYIASSDLGQILALRKTTMRSYMQFGYSIENTGIINPFDIKLSFEAGKSYQKTSLELNYKYSYYGKKSGLDVRIFAGTMLKNSTTDPFYALSSSSRGGPEQYLFEGLYPDRFSKFPKTFWSRQMTMSEGGLVTPVNDSLGYNRWVCSLSLTSNLSGKAPWIPVKPFVNLLLSDRGTTAKKTLFFEAGLKAGIWDFFEIYFPLLVSENLSAIRGSFKERIRFVFRLDRFSPLR